MAAPRPFNDHRYVGDKRTYRVHDVENEAEACDLDGVVAAEKVLLVAPDTLPEARNRGFRPCKECAPA